MNRWLATLACLAIAAPATASVVERLEEEIRLLGSRPLDAIHGACRGEAGLPEPPGGDLPAALVAMDEAHPIAREGNALLAAMRRSAETREALRKRCVGALDLWRVSREHPGTSADAGIERPDAVVACLPAIDEVRAQIADQAARCMQLVRRAHGLAAGRKALLPFGLSEKQTQAELSSALLCDDEEFCEMPTHEATRRDPGWLGEVPESIVVKFNKRQGVPVLEGVGALSAHANCEHALAQVARWSRGLGVIAATPRAVVLEGEGFGKFCGPPTRYYWIDDFGVELQAFEDDGVVYSSARVFFRPHQGEDDVEGASSGGL